MDYNSRAFKSGPRLCITLPAQVIRTLKIQAGNRLNVKIENPQPDVIEPADRGRRFIKEKEAAEPVVEVEPPAAVEAPQPSEEKEPEPVTEPQEAESVLAEQSDVPTTYND